MLGSLLKQDRVWGGVGWGGQEVNAAPAAGVKQVTMVL